MNDGTDRRSFLKRFFLGASTVVLAQAAISQKAIAALSEAHILPEKFPEGENSLVDSPLGEFVEVLMDNLMKSSTHTGFPLVLVKTPPDSRHSVQMDIRFSTLSKLARKYHDGKIHTFKTSGKTGYDSLSTISGNLTFFMDHGAFSLRKALNTPGFMKIIAMVVNQRINDYAGMNPKQLIEMVKDVDISWCTDSEKVTNFLSEQHGVSKKTIRDLSWRLEVPKFV
jgi:hypothetical protein